MISLCTAFFIIRALIAGGGAPEIEVSIRLAEHARTLTGMEAYCVRAFAEALEIIPFTLSENAGLNPIATVTELRNRHAQVKLLLESTSERAPSLIFWKRMFSSRCSFQQAPFN
ncbi:T-complex protein 1 subunit delta [Desmophyllum pertusum]|uniref:T-complex protein 1 subunit delta n=1 Tax=Desmophyllum pertusum TaxID=174260 RepID=A0A9X0A0X2_9CNID|nr:T-complex protein 1 subunit delta [Desmophyllum pertusum]